MEVQSQEWPLNSFLSQRKRSLSYLCELQRRHAEVSSGEEGARDMLTLPFPEGAEEEVLEPAEAHPETSIQGVVPFRTWGGSVHLIPSLLQAALLFEEVAPVLAEPSFIETHPLSLDYQTESLRSPLSPEAETTAACGAPRPPSSTTAITAAAAAAQVGAPTGSLTCGTRVNGARRVLAVGHRWT